MISINIDKKMTGEILKEIRINKKLTLNELSKLTGISATSLKAYEYGYRIPPLKKAVILANNLNISLDKFIIYKIQTN